MTPESADFQASVFVNGMVDEIRAGGVATGKQIINSGHWHARFLLHPLVKKSIVEGWDRELRSAVIAIVRNRIMLRQPYFEIDKLMPDDEWIEAQRSNAARYAEARQFQIEKAEQYGTYDDFLTKTKGKGGGARPLGPATRDVLKAMQRNSPNVGLHRERKL